MNYLSRLFRRWRYRCRYLSEPDVWFYSSTDVSNAALMHSGEMMRTHVRKVLAEELAYKLLKDGGIDIEERPCPRMPGRTYTAWVRVVLPPVPNQFSKR